MSVPAPPSTGNHRGRHERLGRKPNLALGLFVASGCAAVSWFILRIYYFNRWSDWWLHLLASPLPLLVLAASLVGVWLLFDLVALGESDLEALRLHHRMRRGWRSLEEPHRRQTRRVGIAALVVYVCFLAVFGWLWFAWAWRLF